MLEKQGDVKNRCAVQTSWQQFGASARQILCGKNVDVSSGRRNPKCAAETPGPPTSDAHSASPEGTQLERESR